MRKYILILNLILVFTITSYSQTLLPLDTASGKIVYKEIIELDTTYNASRIYSIVKEWLSTNTKNFNRSNSDKNYGATEVIVGIDRGNSTQLDQLYKIDQPLVLQDPTENKLIGKTVLKFTGGTFGCIRIFYIESDIKIYIKDYKLKIEITNINYTHYNQVSMKQSQIYGFSDSGNCNSKNTIENLLKCSQCKSEFEKLYTYLNTDMYSLIKDLNNFLKANKKSNDGW